MRNLFEENPKLVIGLAIFVVIVGYGVSDFLKSRQEKTLNQIEQIEGGERQPDTKRLAEVRRIEYQDPDLALTKVEVILASPQDENEARQAREKHANILQLCFHKQLKAGQVDEAKLFMERLGKEHPDSFHIKGVTRKWAEEQGKLCRIHFKEGRLDDARPVLISLAEKDWLFQDTRLLNDYQTALVDAWNQVGTTSSAGRKWLLQAAEVWGQANAGSPLIQALRQSKLEGKQMIQLAEAQAKANPFRAIPFYQAALLRLNDGGRPWLTNQRNLSHREREQLRQQCDQKLANLFLDLSEAVTQGKRPLITTFTAEEILREGANQLQTVHLRTPLWQRLIQAKTARLMSISKPTLAYSLLSLASDKRLPPDEHNQLNDQLREAGNLANDILRSDGVQLWTSLLRDTSFNPWPLIPDTLRAEFDKRRSQGQQEDHLRQSLASKANSADFQIPLEDFRPTRQRLCEINARRGLLIYPVQPQECVMWMRTALASNEDPLLRDAIFASVAQALLNSRGSEKFKAFYELTSFFVGDIGLDNLPPSLRGKFNVALGEAASTMASRERAKAIFLWAIQAEAYAQESQGEIARQQAVEAAFQEVAGTSLKTIKSENLLPSGLDNVSVLSIDNSTEHHLLVFYRGPETFFLACRPYRKVSAVLKNGNYDIAVIAPSGVIQPYRGQVAMNSNWQKSNYHIETSSTQTRQPEFTGPLGSTASGEYRLARKPTGTGEFRIDKRTGAVKSL